MRSKNQSLLRNKRFLCVLLIFLAVILSPFALRKFSRVEFNQFLVQKLELRYGNISAENFLDSVRSSYLFGVNLVFRNLNIQAPLWREPNFEQPTEVFEYVFSYIPYYAVVYPTEKFYYYSFPLTDFGLVAGNMRLADLDKGTFDFTYFPVNPVNGEKSYKSIKLKNGEDGVVINKIKTGHYEISFKGKTVHFKIPDYAHEPSTATLLEEEKLIGHLFDESGTGFILIYNKKTNAFYEILDAERGFSDTFEPVADGYVLGQRTKFLYFNDTENDRKILVGVNSENSFANNYLDGPADQVPIDINFKADLTRAYPSVITGDGTDDFGVWLNKPEWQRFALTPFHYFTNPQSLIDERKHCFADNSDKSVFWTCLTKEWWNTPEWRAGILSTLVKEGKQGKLKELGIGM